LSANSLLNETYEEMTNDETTRRHNRPGDDGAIAHEVTGSSLASIRFSISLHGKPLSSWSRSHAKRLFDCLCVVPALPLLVPVMCLIALAVRLTSEGPALFVQERMGRYGRTFKILKFRTMIHATDKAHHAVTTAGNQSFTPIGPFLRRWKLDELPQMLNILRGEMSLVGPRPKLPEHVTSWYPCRPGITGAATITFAREEEVLDRIPKQDLNTYYHSVVLPAKRQLDADYMATATFVSDLKLIVNSVLRRWDTSLMESMLSAGVLPPTTVVQRPKASISHVGVASMPIAARMDAADSVERLRAV